MSAFDHWHPVLLSTELKRKPVRARLLGEDLVLFRTADGAVGALRDQCLHRRMRLSAGWVEGDRVVCPYHGWSYTARGELHSPGTPALKACARSYDVIERYGAVWITRPGSGAKFPELPEGGGDILTLKNCFTSPLEVVLDNFTELEHAATTHALFAYDRTRVDEVEVEMKTTEDTIRLVARGPQRKLPRVMELAFGIRGGDTFVDTWTHHFSPVYAVYEHEWYEPRSKRLRRRGMTNCIFFVPITGGETHLFSFVMLPPNLRAAFLLKHVVRAVSDYEMELDARMLKNLADQGTSLQGMRLGRFDPPLGETRKRLRRIYYGADTPAEAAE